MEAVAGPQRGLQSRVGLRHVVVQTMIIFRRFVQIDSIEQISCRLVLSFTQLVHFCPPSLLPHLTKIYTMYYTTLHVCGGIQLRLTSLRTQPMCHLGGCWPGYVYETTEIKSWCGTGPNQSPPPRWTLIPLNNRWCFLWGPFPGDINRLWCSYVQYWCWNIN